MRAEARRCTLLVSWCVAQCCCFKLALRARSGGAQGAREDGAGIGRRGGGGSGGGGGGGGGSGGSGGGGRTEARARTPLFHASPSVWHRGSCVLAASSRSETVAPGPCVAAGCRQTSTSEEEGIIIDHTARFCREREEAEALKTTSEEEDSSSSSSSSESSEEEDDGDFDLFGAPAGASALFNTQVSPHTRRLPVTAAHSSGARHVSAMWRSNNYARTRGDRADEKGRGGGQGSCRSRARSGPPLSSPARARVQPLVGERSATPRPGDARARAG